MKIIHAPHHILNSSVAPIKTITKRVQNYAHEMVKTLNNQNNPIGVGLAANQVNLNLAFFVMKPTRKAKTEIFINPSILETKESPQTKKKDNPSLEGCLSIPRIWGEVKRAQSVLLKYQTLHGEWKIEWFSGFKAVIIQHEIDHLHGILFTQRVIEQQGVLYEEKNGKLHEKRM